MISVTSTKIAVFGIFSHLRVTDNKGNSKLMKGGKLFVTILKIGKSFSAIIKEKKKDI